MSIEKQYIVTVQFPAGVVAQHRERAGIVVDREQGYTGPLSAEQLDEIKADDYLTVVNAGSESTASESSAQAAKIVADAKAEATKITDAAKALAKDITDKAKADAKATADAAKAAPAS